MYASCGQVNISHMAYLFIYAEEMRRVVDLFVQLREEVCTLGIDVHVCTTTILFLNTGGKKTTSTQRTNYKQLAHLNAPVSLSCIGLTRI